MAFPGQGEAQKVKFNQRKVRANFAAQPTPLHDFINFKQMGGNEIILNLDNHDNLSNSELVGGMIELGKRDTNQEHDWNNHPVTVRCVEDLKNRIPSMTAKHVLQCSILLDSLRIIDQEVWQLTAHHVLRLLHKYKGRDMALFLHMFDKDVLDEDGEPFTYLLKAKPEFFERIVSFLPMHVPALNNEQLVRTLEVLVRRELGSDRLFLHYIYLKLERGVL